MCLINWKSCSYTDKMCVTRPESNPYHPEENKSCVQILCLTSYGMSVKCESGHLRCATLTLAAVRSVLRENSNRFKLTWPFPCVPPPAPLSREYT